MTGPWLRPHSGKRPLRGSWRSGCPRRGCAGGPSQAQLLCWRFGGRSQAARQSGSRSRSAGDRAGSPIGLCRLSPRSIDSTLNTARPRLDCSAISSCSGLGFRLFQHLTDPGRTTEDAVLRCAVKVPHSLDGPIVLSRCLFQLHAHPVSRLELCCADKAYGPDPSIVELDLLSDRQRWSAHVAGDVSCSCYRSDIRSRVLQRPGAVFLIIRGMECKYRIRETRGFGGRRVDVSRGNSSRRTFDFTSHLPHYKYT